MLGQATVATSTILTSLGAKLRTLEADALTRLAIETGFCDCACPPRSNWVFVISGEGPFIFRDLGSKQNKTWGLREQGTEEKDFREL